MRALQAFGAFGRLGSATAAAGELGVTVGAVSQQLRNVEAALGLRLIERRGKAIVLTARGRRYHDSVRQAFDQLREAQETLHRSVARSALTISCLPSLSSKWIGGQLLDWQLEHSSAAVRLVGDDDEPDLGREGVGFRITYGALAARHPHRTDLFTDWVVPACAPALLDRLRPTRPEHILDAPLIGIEWEQKGCAAPDWSDWARRIGHPPPSAHSMVRFSISSAAIDAAINGHGFVLAQLSLAAADIASGRLATPFDIRLKLAEPYVLAWNPAVLEIACGADLRNWILMTARRQRALSAPPGE